VLRDHGAGSAAFTRASMGMFGSTRAVFLDCIDVEHAVEAAGINGVVGAALRAAGASHSAMVFCNT